jgi:hypothetical protein
MKADALETDPSNHTPRCYPSKVIGILEYSFDIYIYIINVYHCRGFNFRENKM